jgi:hypothetical protein
MRYRRNTPAGDGAVDSDEIRLDLIDEYRVRLVPYLAGEGARLFSDLPRPARLEFASATPAGRGITELAFRR